MKNPLKTYSFWIKIIGAALLIAFSIWLLVDEAMAVFIVLMLTGLVAGIFAIIRVIPLLRTLKTGRAKLTCFVEILIHLLLAVIMVFGAISIIQNKDADEEKWFATFMEKNYRFFIAFFFETRVIAYFMCAVLFKEETDKTKFWVHILLLILGCVICALANLNAHVIAIVIAVLALLCASGLIIDGGVGYNRYRKTIVKERKEKEVVEEPKEEGKEAPAKEEVIVPMIDENQEQDQTQVS